MGFKKFLVKRVAIAFAILLIVISINYAIFFIMPGNPTALFVNPRGMDQKTKDLMIKRLIEQWGLDKPPEIRFLIYAKNMLTWDFGRSIASGEAVSVEMGQRFLLDWIGIGGNDLSVDQTDEFSFNVFSDSTKASLPVRNVASPGAEITLHLSSVKMFIQHCFLTGLCD